MGILSRAVSAGCGDVHLCDSSQIDFLRNGKPRFGLHDPVSWVLMVHIDHESCLCAFKISAAAISCGEYLAWPIEASRSLSCEQFWHGSIDVL